MPAAPSGIVSRAICPRPTSWRSSSSASLMRRGRAATGPKRSAVIARSQTAPRPAKRPPRRCTGQGSRSTRRAAIPAPWQALPRPSRRAFLTAPGPRRRRCGPGESRRELHHEAGDDGDRERLRRSQRWDASRRKRHTLRPPSC
jgi:hypothetical protein